MEGFFEDENINSHTFYCFDSQAYWGNRMIIVARSGLSERLRNTLIQLIRDRNESIDMVKHVESKENTSLNWQLET